MSSLPQDVINSLAEEGFPEKVSNAFQKAADELNCVIWSRVPGKACTTLIDEGYNLKPFYIHGKSCNWGPMAGFVCQLPPLNKAGINSMDYNFEEHLNSLTWLGKKQGENLKSVKEELLKIEENNFEAKYEKEIEVKDEDKVKPSPLVTAHHEMARADFLMDMKFSTLKNKTVASHLFLPLTISDARKEHLKKVGDLGELDKGYKILSDEDEGKVILGIAKDKDKDPTVVVEYLMYSRALNKGLPEKLDKNRVWDLYHRNIYIKETSSGSYISYLKKLENGFNIQNQPETKEEQTKIYNEAIKNYNLTIECLTPNCSSSLDTQLRDLLSTNGVIISDQTDQLDKWYPLSGLQSPYLVYKEEKDRYKNAVSGDYDLFAVWPLVPGTGLEMTTRLSERKSKQSSDDKIQNLFIPVEAKNYALEITKSRNVFIEFIGSFQELVGKEDLETGNISELVFNTAQMINSLVYATYMNVSAEEKIDKDKKIDTVEPDQHKKDPFPNRAFHSDEGGRPQVNEIEYPLAYFCPEVRDLKESDKSKQLKLARSAGLVKSHVDFLNMILSLRKQFYVFLHDGWVMHLMCLAAEKRTIEQHATTVEENKKTKPQKYFNARMGEMERLGDSLTEIRALLKKLLSPLPSKASSLTKEDQTISDAYDKAFDDVMKSFIDFASRESPYSSDGRIVKMLGAKLDLRIPEENPDAS